MKSVTVAMMALMALVVAETSSAETRQTKLALNWESLATGPNETVKSRARIPSAYVYFTRDIANVSTDLFTIVSDGGAVCSAMVRSTDPVYLSCGSLQSYYYLKRDGGAIELSRVEEIETPPPPPPAGEGPRVLPPPTRKTPAKNQPEASDKPGRRA